MHSKSVAFGAPGIWGYFAQVVIQPWMCISLAILKVVSYQDTKSMSGGMFSLILATCLPQLSSS